MSRPATHDDLTADQRKGAEIFRVDMTKLPATSGMLTALGTFMKATEAAKFTTERAYGSLYVYLPPTAQELDEALDDAKARWDRAAQLYDAALISGTEPEDYTRTTIRNHARDEGLPLPWELGAPEKG